MKIGFYYHALELHRKEKIVYGRLLKPHLVLSTCRCNGGLREDIEYIYNHQSCEPSRHLGTDLCQVAVKEPERYQQRICKKAGIPCEKSVGLGTAANMNNAAVAVETFKELEVIAVTTAGVGTNGGRAGDPASYYQSREGAQSLGKPTPAAGTINTMLFVSEEMTPGAMVVAATMIAEAKASVLQELMAPSRYSDGLATGTGTDQIAIASLQGSEIKHTDANKHSKLGELIGKAVRSSLKQALNLQCGMTPDSRRSCVANLQRFGETQAGFIAGVQSYLEASRQALLESNFLSVNHDPVTVASAQALIHARDQIAWGVIPTICIQEIFTNFSSQVASAVSGRGLELAEFKESLAAKPFSMDNESFLDLMHRAVAYGFARKWEGRFED